MLLSKPPAVKLGTLFPLFAHDDNLTSSRLLRDAKLFDAKLGQLDGAGNTGTYLMQLVEGKTVAEVVPEAKSEPKTEEKKADDEPRKTEEKQT